MVAVDLNTDPVTNDILALVQAALLFQIGMRLWSLLEPGHLAHTIAIPYVFGAGIALLITAVSNFNTDEYAYHLGGFTLLAMAVASIAVWFHLPRPWLGTDGLLFTRYATEVLTAGGNPYAVSMAPAQTAYGVELVQVTPRIDGSIVESFSYPAGAFVAFLPQKLLDIGRPEMFLTLFVPTVVLSVYVLAVTPRSIALAAPITFFASRDLYGAALAGINDILWVAPLAISLVLWSRDRWRYSALAIGIACAMKQQPWLVTPFLAIWLWKESIDVSNFARRARECILWGLGGFLALNLPFMIWNPRAWLAGVLTPMFGSEPALVHQGVGLTLLTMSGQVILPKSYYTVLTMAVFSLSVVLYWLWFDRLKWTAWLAPGVILFFNYRSLANYFNFLPPLALLALLASHGMIKNRKRRSIPTSGLLGFFESSGGTDSK